MNTDKYEGHTDGSGWIWEAFWDKELVKFGKTDRQLIADAPKLLAEVKRLREEAKEVKEWVVRLERFQTMVGDYHLKAFIDAWDKVETGHKTTLEREEE